SLVPGVQIYDAHMHIGVNDPDGFKATAPQIVHALELANARGVVFPFHEPDGYREANDHVIAAAAASGGRFVAFCRVDPNAGDAVGEAARALDAGARGIKLHPRAEGFSLDEPEVRRVFEVAHERRVPVLIHAGRGIPALGRHTVELARALPGAQVILAHCGISDLAWIWRDARELPNLYFDTSWWAVADVMVLCNLVPPGQILFASDAPYGTPAQHAPFVLRCALQSGLSHEQIRGVMGGQIERLVEAQDPLDLGPALDRRERPTDLLLQRVETFLTTAIGRIFSGDDGHETLALARLACDVPPDDPRAGVCASIVRLLDLHDQVAEDGPRTPGSRGIHLVITAMCLAATPDAGAP
ncbi:MAG TPA: amidohydrolase family protein, partial [Thermoleophilaceae bacterium]|nr:amidohydrolase family protein [Thermoleophilaceae bacterium]